MLQPGSGLTPCRFPSCERSMGGRTALAGPDMARNWLSIRVELIEGHGEHYWPRPGRIFAAARSHTFRDLADAIDDAFARWDRSHLQEFTLASQTRLCIPDPDWEAEGAATEDFRRARLSRLELGEQFIYVFDLGDEWTHLCTVGASRIDPRRRSGHPAGQAAAVLGLGRHPRSVPPSLGGRRRRVTHAARSRPRRPPVPAAALGSGRQRTRPRLISRSSRPAGSLRLEWG